MPSFDVVNKIDFQEVDNAVNNTKKEIETRYDFRGNKAEILFSKADKKISLLASDEMKLDALYEMFLVNYARRKLDVKSIEIKERESAAKGYIKQDLFIQEGIPAEEAKKIIKFIKESKCKVQASIQDEQVRVVGKKIDDLQEVISVLRVADVKVPLQFVNMKS
ncbi:MAG: YajQ family cyclic di-GMP-binding protein [Desulfovibrionaceae bacterium]